jgi:hypothetical protein
LVNGMTMSFLTALLTRKRVLTIWFGSVLFFPVTNLLLVFGVFGTSSELAPSPFIKRYQPTGNYLTSINYESTSSWQGRLSGTQYSFSERRVFLYQQGNTLVLVKSESTEPRSMFESDLAKALYIGEVVSTAYVLSKYPALEEKVMAELQKAQLKQPNLQLSPWMFYEVQQWPGKYLFAAFVLPVYGKLVESDI